MYLNMRTITRPPSWLSWLYFWRTPKHTDASATQQEKQPRGPYADTRTMLRNTRRIFQRRTAIPPISPTRNERGEVIFSSRVDTQFRDGYERYRNAFERKRKEKLEAQRRSNSIWSRIHWPFSRDKPAPSKTEPEKALHAKAT